MLTSAATFTGIASWNRKRLIWHLARRLPNFIPRGGPVSTARVQSPFLKMGVSVHSGGRGSGSVTGRLRFTRSIAHIIRVVALRYVASDCQAETTKSQLAGWVQKGSLHGFFQTPTAHMSGTCEPPLSCCFSADRFSSQPVSPC